MQIVTTILSHFSKYMRRKRFKIFEKLVCVLPRPLRIIDIGGTIDFWETCGWAGKRDADITLINIESEKKRYSNIDFRLGDGTNLSKYSSKSFDVAVSNSVIEHVGTFEMQKKFANEIQRVGRAYWVQTPNFYFPIEQHYLIPCLHWLPRSIRIAVFRQFRSLCKNPKNAARIADRINLLTHKKLRQLFPNANIIPERFSGLVKSWIVFGGF